MRAMHLLFDDIFEILGGVENAAEVLGTNIWVLRKIEEPVDRNGREPTVKLVQKTLGKLSILNLPAAQTLTDELLGHFVMPAHRYLIRPDTLALLERIWAAVKNGGDPTYREATVFCQHDGTPLMFLADGKTHCTVCAGKGAGAGS